jgi:hypothetical protein
MAIVTVTQHKTLTQEQWENYKSLFPNDERLQALTLEELIKNTDGGKVDWTKLPMSKEVDVDSPPIVASSSITITECEKAIAFVIFDVICLAVGGVGLRSGVSSEDVEAIAKAAKPVLSELEASIAEIANSGASVTDRAWAVFKILKAIWSGDCLGAVVSAFVSSLSWYDALLYGVTAMATILAFVATDGVALVGEVVIELATFGFLVDDSVKAVNVC